MSKSTRVNLSPSNLIVQAWETFKRRPWLAIGMWIVYAMFLGGSGGGGSQQSNEKLVQLFLNNMALLLVLLALVLLFGPICGGYGLAILRLIRGDDSVSFHDLFTGFSKFRRLCFTWLLYTLAVIGGMLLFIVPGIILLIALWPAFLLVMEDDLASVDAIKGAWALTRGHKMELFVLVLATFIVLIGGLLVAGPITQLAWVRAYQRCARLPEVV